MTRQVAPISLDLDNKWSYLMTHGEPTWVDYPSYLDVLVPRVLDFLDERDLTITFFIVGRDAVGQRHRDLLAEIVRRGHRIGNHSHNHEPWLLRYDDAQIVEELDRSEEAIGEATGIKPLGFRGPGFSLSDGVLAELARRGYEYDASVFPNILNPLSRAYYFRTAKMTEAEKEERAELFGTLSSSLRPNRPYTWMVDGGDRLTEVPVTTFPGLRTPIHLSYLSYLGGKARWLASGYHRASITACKITNNPPSMLLHPLDFLGADDDTDLRFFPGMGMPSGQKLDLAAHFIGRLQESYTLVPMEEYVAGLTTRLERVPDYSA
jgi:peptidoglycan-N-acetylglucosamine deacetylase